MQNISFDKARVNVQLLDFELKAALPSLAKGISTGRGKVIVHLDDDAIGEDMALAEQIVINHDESGLTADQQKKQQREAEIAVGRQSYDAPLDPASISLEDIARRMMWLEQELRDLRGL